MLKITAIISLFLIASLSHAEYRRSKKEDSSNDFMMPGSAVWGQGISCDSCGSECAAACGTRHFRSCCFNYLRKKRPDVKTRYYSDGKRPQEYPMYTENIPDDRYTWFYEKLPGNIDMFYDRD